jgi:hypothetical protein
MRLLGFAIPVVVIALLGTIGQGSSARVTTRAIPTVGPVAPASSYLSPTYGYAVNWDAQLWEVDAEATQTQSGIDTLLLGFVGTQDGERLFGSLYLHGFPSSTTDARQCAEGALDSGLSPFAGLKRALTTADLPGVTGGLARDLRSSSVEGDAALAYRTYDYSYALRYGSSMNFGVEDTAPPPLNWTPYRAYVECRVLIPQQAMLMIVLRANQEDYGHLVAPANAVLDRLDVIAAAPQPAQPVQSVPGNSAPAGTLPGSGEMQTRYTSTTHGFTLDFDSSIWQVVDEASFNGDDFILLWNGVSRVEFGAFDHFGSDVGLCLDTVATAQAHDPALHDVGPARDETGALVAGQDDASAWSVYQGRGDLGNGETNLIIYLECQAMVWGQSVLGTAAIMPLATMDTELPIVEALLAGRQMPTA